MQLELFNHLVVVHRSASLPHRVLHWLFDIDQKVPVSAGFEDVFKFRFRQFKFQIHRFIHFCHQLVKSRTAHVAVHIAVGLDEAHQLLAHGFQLVQVPVFLLELSVLAQLDSFVFIELTVDFVDLLVSLSEQSLSVLLGICQLNDRNV